jgi:hypothetical protein
LEKKGGYLHSQSTRTAGLEIEMAKWSGAKNPETGQRGQKILKNIFRTGCK